MLDIKFIREHVEEVKKNCKNRNVKCNIDRLLELDKMRLSQLQYIEELQAEKNKLNELLPKTTGEEKTALLEQGKAVKEKLTAGEPKLEKINAEFQEILITIPNIAHPDVKVSDDEDDNPVLEVVKEPMKFNFKPLDHVQIAENLDLIDFERATKVSGAKFYYLKTN